MLQLPQRFIGDFSEFKDDKPYFSIGEPGPSFFPVQ